MPLDAVVKLRSLRVRQRQRVGFQAFPNCIQQFRFLGGGESFYLLSQIAHEDNPSAVSLPWQGRFAWVLERLFL